MNDKQKLWDKILREFDGFLSLNKTKNEIHKFAIDLMAKNLPYFNWTGLYFLKDGVLELFDYYIGKPTDHTRINIGQGVCGSAVAEERDIIVDDVLSTGGTLKALLLALKQMKVEIKGVFIAIDKGNCAKQIGDEFDLNIEALIVIDVIDGKVVIKA